MHICLFCNSLRIYFKLEYGIAIIYSKKQNVKPNQKTMKNLPLLCAIILLIAGNSLTAQVAVNTDGSDPDGSAMLDVQSSDKGLLPPRMTQAQIEAIVNPANGLMVFNTTDDKLYIYRVTDNEWKEVNFGAGTLTPPFVCGQSLVDDRDSKSYPTVLIGTQCWMAENLNIGTWITTGTTQSLNTPEVIEKYCYNNLEANCDIYGGLYQWAEAVQYLNGASNTTDWSPVPTGNVPGICPDGWHLPTLTEWQAFITFLQSESSFHCNSNVHYYAKSLAATTNWNSSTNTCAIGNNLSENNETGFTALGAGYFIPGNPWSTIDESIDFWSTSSSATSATHFALHYGGTQFTQYGGPKNDAFSARCLKD